MKNVLKIMLAGSLLWSSAAFAEVAVIVHKSNADDLSPELIQRIFLGKTKGFPSAGKAVPLDLPQDTQSRADFLAKVVKKTQSQYTAYWAKLMFTGKGVPPKEADTANDVVTLVGKNPNMIGYVDASEVTADVRVVAKF